MSSLQGFLKVSTAKDITVLMVDTADHITGKTGLTITKYLSKNGATPYAATITTTEIDSTNVKGVYKLALADSDVDTVGELQIHLTGTGADPADYKYQISTYLPGEAATLQADQAVNTTKFGGTTVTARDIGLSVLLSSGTGTGQLDITSGIAKSNLTQILGTALTETAGQIAAAFKKFFDIASPTSTMNLITAVTTATNLTNAPTSGDLTATMKTSVTTAATAATPTAAAVTGNVGGNVVGSVGSVTGLTASDVGAIKTQTDKLTFDSDNYVLSHPMTGVTVTTNNDKTGYTVSTVSDKTGYSLTSAYDPAKTAAQDSDMATALSFLDATISSRLAGASYTAPDNASIAGIKLQTDKLTFDSDNYVESHPMTAITVGDVTLAASQPNYAPATAADVPTANANADALLKRDWTAISGEASRSVLNALRFIRNKFSTTASAGNVTVYKEDDTTAAYTKALTTDSDAQPIVEG